MSSQAECTRSAAVPGCRRKDARGRRVPSTLARHPPPFATRLLRFLLAFASQMQIFSSLQPHTVLVSPSPCLSQHRLLTPPPSSPPLPTRPPASPTDLIQSTLLQLASGVQRWSLCAECCWCQGWRTGARRERVPLFWRDGWINKCIRGHVFHAHARQHAEGDKDAGAHARRQERYCE